jgi:hypothetical protein
VSFGNRFKPYESDEELLIPLCLLVGGVVPLPERLPLPLLALVLLLPLLVHVLVPLQS